MRNNGEKQSHWILKGVYKKNYNYIISKSFLICSIFATISLITSINEYNFASTRDLWNDIIIVFITNFVQNLVILFVSSIFIFLLLQYLKIDITRLDNMLNKIAIKDTKSNSLRSSSLANIVFFVIFAIIFIFLPNILGAYKQIDGEYVFINLFNQDIFNKVRFILLIAIGLDIIENIIKFIQGTYTKIVVLSTIILEILGLALAYINLFTLPIFNQNFVIQAMDTLNNSFNLTDAEYQRFMSIDFPRGIFMIILVFSFVSVIEVVYKFNNHKKKVDI